MRKTWDDLLWGYLSGTLSPEDRQQFEHYLAESAERRKDLREWQQLRASVRDDAEARATGDLPPLRLNLTPTRQNGSQQSVNERGQTMTTYTRPQVRPTGRFSGILVAAVVGMILIGTVLFFFANNDGGNDQFGALGTATPPPSDTPLEATATFTSSPTFVIVGPSSMPPLASITPSSTPIPSGGVFPTAIQPTLPPPSQMPPVMSVTPSMLDPIISAPATRVFVGRLPSGEVAWDVDWSAERDLIAVAADGGLLFYEPDQLDSPAAFLDVTSGSGILSVAFNNSGDLLAALSWSNELTVWDISDPQSAELLDALDNAPLWGDLRFEGDTITSTLRDGVVRLAGESLMEQVQRVAYPFYSPSRRLALTEVEGQTMIVNTTDDTAVQRFDVALTAVRVAFDPDETRVVIPQEREITIYDVETGAVLGQAALQGRVDAAEASDEGVAYVVTAGTLNTVQVWEDGAAEPYAALVYDIPFRDVAFGPDGTQLIVLANDGRLILLEL